MTSSYLNYVSLATAIETNFFSLFLTVQHECIPQAILGMDVICQV